MIYSTQHIYVLLGGMMIDTELARTATQQLTGALIATHGQDITQGMIFEAIKEHVDKYSIPPETGWLSLHLEASIEALIQQPEARARVLQMLGTFLKTLSGITKKSKEVCRDILAHFHELWVLGPARRAAVGTVDISGLSVSQGNIDTMRNALLAVDKAANSSAATGIVTDLFAPMVDDSGSRRRTGIPWIDSLMGGGLGPVSGCVMGVLAPSGGGKTTLGNEMAIAGALMGEHTVLAMAEEGLTRQVKLNIMARTTGIPTPELDKIAFWDIKEVCNLGIRYKLEPDDTERRIQLVAKNLHVIDLVATDGGIEQIEQAVERLADDFGAPRLIYIDWAGVIADRIVSVGLHGRKYEEKREAILAVVAAAVNLAVKTNQQVVVSQQMSPQAVARGPGGASSLYDAFECKMFGSLCKYVLNIGPVDIKLGLQLARFTKARNDKANQHAVLRLKGEIGTFEDVSASFALNGKRFKPMAPEPKVPTDRRTPNPGVE